MKVVLVNVKYSPNLGDGVISECLENGLKARLQDVVIENCDLAGREMYGDGNRFIRTLALSILPWTPEKIKKAVYKPLLASMVRNKLLPVYEKHMADADLVIFGGGQIFADADLNFPMKVAGAASVAREKNLPIAIHAVGVGRIWSEDGAMLFKEAFAGCHLVWASVRGPLSQKRWRRHFINTDVTEPHISYDPGLLAKKVYGPVNGEDRARRNRPRIGLCVTHPATLKLHFDGETPREINLESFYQNCVKILAERGMEVMLFTNGAPDDETYMHHCFPKFALDHYEPDQVMIAEESAAPSDLVDKIRICDGVIAHRLHASVVAYSYGIPHVGLSTNRKIEEFFALTGRSDFALKDEMITPEHAADAIQRALEIPISVEQQTKLLSKVNQDLDELASIVSTVKKRRRSNGGVN